MEKLKLYDKEDNVYIMSLCELKNMLYTDKKINEESKTIIKNIIAEKIKDSLLEKQEEASESIESSETSKTSETSESSKSTKQNKQNKQNKHIKQNKSTKNNNTETEESDESYKSKESKDDYKHDIKKLYDRVDKKGENQKFTQTSQKLFDRMISHAQVINDSYAGKNINKVSKPFVNDNSDNNRKLGERKFIGKK
jgi:hypothetical protein